MQKALAEMKNALGVHDAWTMTKICDSMGWIRREVFWRNVNGNEEGRGKIVMADQFVSDDEADSEASRSGLSFCEQRNDRV